MSKKQRQGVHIAYRPIPDVFTCGCPNDQCSGAVQPLNMVPRKFGNRGGTISSY